MAAYVQDAIMLFGDSITQGAWDTNGFGQRLAHVYARRLDVLNRGLSGYNTDWAIPVFKQCFATQHEQLRVPRVRILVIWFGANDACIEPSPQHVPLPRFSANIKRLVDMVSSPGSPYYSSATRIILVTPPPVNTYQRGADLASRNPPITLDRLFEVTKAYAEAVKVVAGKENVVVVDIWTEIWKAAGEDEHALSQFLVDGLHLNSEGYRIMYETLIGVISENMPELHYDNLQPVFAPWAEINWDDPATSLTRRQVEGA